MTETKTEKNRTTTSVELCYYIPSQDVLIDTNMEFQIEGDERTSWLHYMVDQNPDTIFFFVVGTTDIFGLEETEESA